MRLDNRLIPRLLQERLETGLLDPGAEIHQIGAGALLSDETSGCGRACLGVHGKGGGHHVPQPSGARAVGSVHDCAATCQILQLVLLRRMCTTVLRRGTND